MPTIRDVAKLAGVSVTTVSAVLNTSIEDKKVALKTREKVNEAIRILGYQPNIAARKLRGSNEQRPVIAVFWPLDARVVVLGTILSNLKSAFDKAYFQCELVVYPFKNDELSVYKDLFSYEAFNGALLGAFSESDKEFLKGLDIKLPLVFYNRYLKDYHTVVTDNPMSGVMAAELIKKNGLKRVIIFQNQNMNISLRQRMEAFIITCEKLGIEIKEQICLNDDDKVQAMEVTYGLVKDERIKDEVCLYCNEQIAYASLFTMMKMGISIPDTVKGLLLSASYNTMISYITPSITSVEYPVDDMLVDCANLLIYGIQHKDSPPIHKTYIPRVVYGDTFPELI